MLRSGETFSLPPKDEPGGDTKAERPHLLLRDRSLDDLGATLAFGSTRSGEVRNGAAYTCVDRDAVGYRGTGLSQKTYFYLSRLVGVDPELLGSARGRLGEEMTSVRASLYRSFGFGSGTTGSGAARGSWRGGFVELAERVVESLDGARYALVATEPGYSRRRGYQHLIPLYNEPGSIGEPGDLQVEADWVSRLAPGSRTGWLALPFVFSGCETGRPRTPGHIRRWTGVCVDDETMARVERALLDWLGLNDLATAPVRG